MKKKNIMCIAEILISTFIFADFSLSVATEKEEKNLYRAIFIDPDEGVSVKTLIAIPGDTVTWINWTKVPAEIHFLDTKVVDATDCPECFSISKEGTYDSVKISLNGAASLRFKKKGKYEYIVKQEPKHFWGREKEFLGSIWVKEGDYNGREDK